MALVFEKPVIGNNVFIARSADVMGKVEIADNASIWYGTVVRGDVEPITIGKDSNVQELSSLHTSKGYPLTIGEGVTVGHRAILHGCTVEDYALIGMGSIVLDGAVVERESMLGAGSLLPQGKRVPSGYLAIGSPAKVVRALTEDELKFLRESARGYVEEASNHISLQNGKIK